MLFGLLLQVLNPFNNLIFEVVIKSTERNGLYFIPDLLHEFIVLKTSILGIIMLDPDYHLLAVSLKGPFSLDCLVGVEALLEMHVADITTVI